MPSLPVSNKTLVWLGSSAGAIMAIVAVLNLAGVDWPLTEKSPVIREFGGDIEIHELEIKVLKTEQRRIIRKDLFDSIESIDFILTQYIDEDDLSDGDIRQKVRLETEKARYMMQLDAMAKGE